MGVFPNLANSTKAQQRVVILEEKEGQLRKLRKIVVPDEEGMKMIKLGDAAPEVVVYIKN